MYNLNIRWTAAHEIVDILRSAGQTVTANEQERNLALIMGPEPPDGWVPTVLAILGIVARIPLGPWVDHSIWWWAEKTETPDGTAWEAGVESRARRTRQQKHIASTREAAIAWVDDAVRQLGAPSVLLAGGRPHRHEGRIWVLEGGPMCGAYHRCVLEWREPPRSARERFGSMHWMDLRAWRGTLELSQAEIARLMGVHRRKWQRWEYGEVKIPPWVEEKLSEVSRRIISGWKETSR